MRQKRKLSRGDVDHRYNDRDVDHRYNDRDVDHRYNDGMDESCQSKNKQGEMILDKLEMAEVLGQQYYSILQEPFEDMEDPAFKASLSNLDLGLSDFTIDPTRVREILQKLPTKSVPGPDGIPPHCLKFGGGIQ